MCIITNYVCSVSNAQLNLLMIDKRNQSMCKPPLFRLKLVCEVSPRFSGSPNIPNTLQWVVRTTLDPHPPPSEYVGKSNKHRIIPIFLRTSVKQSNESG